MMVNLQDTPTAGPLTVADLDEARKHSTGTIWPPRRLAAGMDQQGRYATRQWPQFPDTVPTDFGAPEGGTFREPSSAMQSMRRHDRIKYRIVLALLLGVAGYVSHIAWPMLAA